MPFIKVIRDPVIKQSDIQILIGRDTNPEQVGAEYEKNIHDKDKTLICGIQCPLICINGVVVDVCDIYKFELKDIGQTPTCTMTIRDRCDFIQKLATPQVDNELRVQIIPPFDDVYKKINLTFFISSFKKVGGGLIRINGVYKCPKLTNSQFKSFGSISTYSLFDMVSRETGLGFASNVEDCEDKRYMSCSNTSYADILTQEMNRAEGKNKIYDWFVDCWNYLVLVDVKDRYDTVVSNQDNILWVSNQIDENTTESKITPVKTTGILTNMIGIQQSQTFIKSYSHNTKPGVSLSGTDNVYSIYRESDKTYSDIYLCNEDVKKDKYIKYEYLGEVYGDYDSFTPQVENLNYYRKMGGEVVTVNLGQPMLGLYRGEKINIAIYTDDGLYNNTLLDLEKQGLISNAKPDPNLQLPDFNPNAEQDGFKLDDSLSGQYLIIGNTYLFDRNRGWTHSVDLSRPADKRITLVEVEEQSTQEKQISQQDQIQTDIYNDFTPGNNTDTSEPDENQTYNTWMNCVERMGQWYAENMNNYGRGFRTPQPGKHGDTKHVKVCDLLKNLPKTWPSYSVCEHNKFQVWDDCSAFVCACLLLFGVTISPMNTPPAMGPNGYTQNGAWGGNQRENSDGTYILVPGNKFGSRGDKNKIKFGDAMAKAGFKCLPYNEKNLRPGDIVVKTDTHTEIFWGYKTTTSNGKSKTSKRAYSWGRNHNKYDFGGLPCAYANMGYHFIWRYEGK